MCICLRVEQLYPFPLKSLAQELARFKNADLVWCQEEPRNMGAWSFVEPCLEWVLGQAASRRSERATPGRPATAATARRRHVKHLRRIQAFMDEAFGVLRADAGSSERHGSQLLCFDA